MRSAPRIYCIPATRVGITVQAYLHRSEDDLDAILETPGARVRIVKGAYAEDGRVSLARGAELNERFLVLCNRVAASDHTCSIATHDRELLNAALSGFDSCAAGSRYEVEMLYGVNPQLAAEVEGRQLPLRVYLPFGSEWYLYLCHRLAEYPPALIGCAADALGVVHAWRSGEPV